MTISEAEEYVSENYEEEYILEEDDDHCIILNAPGYSITGYNIVCYDGYWFDKIEDQADFSLTAIFKDGEFDYWEQDCMAVTLHNYFTEQGIDIDVYSLQCEIKEGFIMKGGDPYACRLLHYYSKYGFNDMTERKYVWIRNE